MPRAREADNTEEDEEEVEENVHAGAATTTAALAPERQVRTDVTWQNPQRLRRQPLQCDRWRGHPESKGHTLR